MIRVNFAAGKTVAYDLRDEADRRSWERDRRLPIRAVTAVVRDTDPRGTFDAARFVLRAPEGMRVTGWDAVLIRDDSGKPVREEVTCYADRYALILSVWYTDTTGADLPTARVDWVRTGRLRLRSSD